MYKQWLSCKHLFLKWGEVIKGVLDKFNTPQLLPKSLGFTPLQVLALVMIACWVFIVGSPRILKGGGLKS